MNNKPSVTVVIPYKNNLKYLYNALNSVFKQTYKNYKILIIYDDEDCNDLGKIQKFLNLKKKKFFSSVKIKKNKKNLGAGYSRNIGIQKSNSKYIAFLDADDIWAKNKLKFQINFMEKNNEVFSHTSYFIINKNNEIVSLRKAKKIIKFKNLLKSCDIGLSTVMINTKFIKKNKYYFPKIKTKEDFVLWLKIAKDIKSVVGIDKKLTFYRKTENSLSSNKIISLLNGYKVYRDYMKFSQIKSLFYLIILSINFLKKNIQGKKI
tara:strand:+ start:6081 stop:6869 length:789 start_codon:yes stop_codon:yes gene_type:complete